MEKNVGRWLSFLSFFSAIFYAIGFIIWNIFLFGLKFNEIELLQSRFIYSGFFFILYLLIVLFLLRFFSIHSNRFEIEGCFIKRSLISLFILSILYSLFLFPYIPRILGGGRPLGMSIMPNGNTLTLDDLDKIGILYETDSDGNKSEKIMQTANVCVAYENSQIILVLLSNRVVQLNKSQLNGLSVLPGDERIRELEKNCGILVNWWILSSYWTDYLKPKLK